MTVEGHMAAKRPAAVIALGRSGTGEARLALLFPYEIPIEPVVPVTRPRCQAVA